MAHSSIQVSPEMRERLKQYKLNGMTYEQTLSFLLDMVSPEEFQRLHAEYQKAVLERIKKSKKWRSFPLE